VKVTELIEKMRLSVETQGSDREITGCYIGDLMSLALSDIFEGNIWVTVQTNINAVAVASHKEASCILLPKGLKPDKEARERAESENMYILSSDKTAYELCVIIDKMI